MARELKRKRVGGSGNAARDVKESLKAISSPIPDEDDTMGDCEDLEAGVKDDVVPPQDGDMDVEEGGSISDVHEFRSPGDPEVTGGIHGRSRVPPSGGELRAIKDASELFKSSSFKLKIDALLPNVRPRSSRIPPLERFLLALHAFLISLPSVPPQHPLEAALKLQQPFRATKKKLSAIHHSVHVPYPEPVPTTATNWKVAFDPPADIALAGSWANQLSVKGKDKKRFTVDVAVEMPATLFQEKDYLDSRFFHKRAFYLASIAFALANNPASGLNVELLYDSPSANARMTTLLLRPQSDGSPTDFSKLNADVRIIAVLPQDSPIPLSRLSPFHSNLRLTSSTSEASGLTPLYNTDLLISSTAKQHLLSAHTSKRVVPSFQDALTLLRVWANQRGYGGAEGESYIIHGFEGRGHWWTTLLQLLVFGEELALRRVKGSAKRKPLGKGLSSYQLFKASLDFLARHDFAVESVFVKSRDGLRFPPEEYRTSHEAVVVDSSSLVNVLAGVPLCSLDMLRHDAQVTLDRLDNASPADDAFDETFLQDYGASSTRFDVVVRVDLTHVRSASSVLDVLDAGSTLQATVNKICTCLRKGLGDRARAIAIMHRACSPRSVSEPHDPLSLNTSATTVQIGLLLNSDHAFRLVDHGPPADEQAEEVTKDFRDFWGEKAELRRFKDGRIMESVVWDVHHSDQRGHIPTMIIHYLLQRHFGIDVAKSIVTWQADFDALLRLPKAIASTYQVYGVAGGFKPAMNAFDHLTKTIRNMEQDLPLGVLAIHPTSPFLRYTSSLNPVPIPSSLLGVLPNCAIHLPTMDIVIEFEKSGRWPDDLKAIQKIKLAFLEQLGTALMKNLIGTTASVAVDPHSEPIQDHARLEIVTPEGWAFSARILHDREMTLLGRHLNEHSHVTKIVQAPVDPEKAREHRQTFTAREVWIRRYIHAPRHHRIITTLSHRHAAYAGTVRLVKRWFASHWLLGGHVGEEAIELLCARPFLDSSTSSGVPGSKERGFACVMALLRRWTWEDGMVVPLHDEASPTQGINATDTTLSPSLNSGSWRFFTGADPTGRMWTSHGPDAVVARRIQTLAQATCDYLRGMDYGSLDVKALFTHPTDDYDVIVQLRPSILPRYSQNVNADEREWTRGAKYSNLPSVAPSSFGRLVDFDPARLLYGDLQRIYYDSIKIFHDPFGGDRFGAVWIPSLKAQRLFRVMGGYSCAPLPKDENKLEKEKGTITLNESAVVSEIERLGGGLIESITVQH